MEATLQFCSVTWSIIEGDSLAMKTENIVELGVQVNGKAFSKIHVLFY